MRFYTLMSYLLLLLIIVFLAADTGAVAPAPGAVKRWIDKGIITLILVRNPGGKE